MPTTRRNRAGGTARRAAVIRATMALALVLGSAPAAAPASLLGGPRPTLAPGPGVPLARVRSAPTPPSGAHVSRSRSPRRLALGVSLAVGGGLLAWWAHGQADHAYANYLDAAGVGAQRRWLAQARRRDRVAGAALLGMEAGLLLTTYWLLH